MNTAVIPNCAMASPATAGPAARATFTLMDDSDAASATCSRGTMSEMTDCAAGICTADAAPSTHVRVRSVLAGRSSPADIAINASDAPNCTTCVTSITVRRFRNSPSTPDGSASSNTGAAEAVCTRATTTGELSSATSCHWAPTVCIQMPILLTNPATHSTRNAGTLSGANGPSRPEREDTRVRGAATVTSAPKPKSGNRVGRVDDEACDVTRMGVHDEVRTW